MSGQNGRSILRQLAVVMLTAAVIGMNWLANALPLNGQGTGEISARFPSLFTPAGYVFGIWGLIYAGLVMHAAYQLLPGRRADPRVAGIVGPYAASCAANIGWVLAWHHEHFLLSMLAMLAILTSLLVVYRRLAASPLSPDRLGFWCTDVPFSLYLGWIIVATVANMAILLLHWGWSGAPLSPVPWTVLMLVVATAIGLLFAWRERNFTCVGVLVWAFIGISVKQGGEMLVAGTALAGAAILAGAVALSLLRPAQRS
ncbi:MAG: hypothetical protein JJT85_05235 [Chromatiales bacterium]|nr:hypothetical protein [Chromatiales bacterium]